MNHQLVKKKLLEKVDYTGGPRLSGPDLDYRNPRNTGIYKTFQVIRLLGLFTNKSSQWTDLSRC